MASLSRMYVPTWTNLMASCSIPTLEVSLATRHRAHPRRMSTTMTELTSISVTRGTILVAAKRDTTLEIASIASESTRTTTQCMRQPPRVTRDTCIGVPRGKLATLDREEMMLGPQ